VTEPQDITAAQRSLGAQLARLREAAGYTQAEFASKVFISRSSVANIETWHSRGTRDF
jgi:DNA-binding XRE family transcriptional regulator